MNFISETYGYEWAIDKIRKETHCACTVAAQSDELFLVNIEWPDGRPLFNGECHEAHIVQFVIEAVRSAYMELVS
jgi:hypothetical protein